MIIHFPNALNAEIQLGFSSACVVLKYILSLCIVIYFCKFIGGDMSNSVCNSVLMQRCYLSHTKGKDYEVFLNSSFKYLNCVVDNLLSFPLKLFSWMTWRGTLTLVNSWEYTKYISFGILLAENNPLLNLLNQGPLNSLEL